MGRKSRHIYKYLIVFVAIFLIVFFSVQWFTKTGIFKLPGVVNYDESLSSAEIAALKEVFTEKIVLDKDVTISARNTLDLPELEKNEFLYEVYLPVTDFYSTETNIDATAPAELFDSSFQAANDFKLIKFQDLDFTQKLLSLNNEYYLDELNAGAVFRILKFDSEKYTEEIRPLVRAEFAQIFPSKDTLLTFAQTGVTAMSRGMNDRLIKVGGDATYFAAQIGDFLSSFDLTHTSNESSFTKYATRENICSDPRFIDTLTAIGLDIVELTGNHNQDCGDQAALDTIEIYEQNNIKIVGGGRTAEEAKKPLEIKEKGSNITMLAFNLSTGGATLDNTPGANQYYEEVAAEQIAAAKKRGDIVIVDIQYYECSAYASTYEDPTCDRADSAAGNQVGFFRHLIELGADVVVGTSAHQAQTFELYGDGVIYYGLGNLFFDQVWWPGTTRSLILAHYIYDNKLLQTKLVGTVYDNTMQTKLLDDATMAWWIKRLASVKP